VEDDVVAAGHVDVSQMQERRHSFLGYRTGLGFSGNACREKNGSDGTFLSALTFYA
jgi:hypothetical protein